MSVLESVHVNRTVATPLEATHVAATLDTDSPAMDSRAKVC